MNNIDQLPSNLTKAQSRILELENSSDDNQIFLNIFNSSPVPYALNDEQGNIINLNPAFTKVFNYLYTSLIIRNKFIKNIKIASSLFGRYKLKSIGVKSTVYFRQAKRGFSVS